MYEYDQVERINQNLICCLCHSPFIEPVQTPCAHVFCSACLSTALSHSLTCPVDRRPLHERELAPAAVVVRNMVDELLVRCSCSELVQRQDFASHRKSACLFSLISCGCGTRLMKKDMDLHKSTCGHRMTVCEGCDAKIRVMDTEDHATTCPSTPSNCRHCSRPVPRSSAATHANACLLAPAFCPQASNGCAWSGERSQLSTHVGTCPFEAIKAFFVIQSAKLLAESAMRMENEGKVDELQSEVGSVRRELNATKRKLDDARQEITSLHTSLLTSLGPYAVSPVSPPPALPPPPLSPVAEFFLQPTSSSASPPSSQDSTTLRLPFVRRRSLPSSHYLTFDPTAPPSNDPQSIRPLPSILGAAGPSMPMRASRASQSPPNQHQHQPSFFGPAPGQADPHFGRVAPSLSTSAPAASERARGRSPPAAPIEVNFNALAETVTDVVRAMDSLERKSDLMLTAETLRLMEEIGALRSITHSIRMQLHHITMNLSSSSSSPTTTTSPSSRRGMTSPREGDLGLTSTAYATPRTGSSRHGGGSGTSWTESVTTRTRSDLASDEGGGGYRL